MITRTLTSSALRTALTCGASAIAIALAPTASAQGGAHQVYLVRSASEVADGVQVTSTNSDILMGRHRTANQSLLVYDVQNGAIVIERGGESTSAPLVSQRGPELSFKYNYETGTLQGDQGTASVFNTWLRPIAATSPAKGVEATWAVATDLRALGVMKAGPAPIGFKLKRTHQQVDGQPVILLEYEIPAFHYKAPGGESVVHWARGFAVVDADFSRIFASGSQHRATATGADGVMRPISVRSSMLGIEADGSSTMGFKNASAIQAALANVAEASGNQVHAVAADGDTAADPFPAMLASYLDMAAFAMTEGGANPVPVTSSVGSSPQIAAERLGTSTGSASTTMLETLGLDPRQPDPAAAQAMADFVLNPPTGAPAGLGNEPNLVTYRPVRQALDKSGIGSVIFVLGGPFPEMIVPDAADSAGRPTSGSTVWVLGGTSVDRVPEPQPDPQPATGTVIFRLGGTPEPETGSVVWQFSKGGGAQQGPGDGANTSSGGGGPVSKGVHAADR